MYPCYCDPEYYNRISEYFDGVFCRVLKDGEWVDKDDYKEIDPKEDKK